MTDDETVLADPTAEGDRPFGCHEWLTEMIAGCVDSTSLYFEALNKHFAVIDREMTGFCKGQVRSGSEVLTMVMALINKHTHPVLRAAHEEMKAWLEPGDQGELSNNILHDWNCWCYRQFRYWHKEIKDQ